LTTYTREKDAIAFLGLMSYMYANWDAPISLAPPPPAAPPVPTEDNVTHYHGLNICGLIVDNTDGEVLALEKNEIHEYNSPVEHGEQRALRAAIARINVKRPRGPDTTVEDYYRSQMFYADGDTPSAYIDTGSTLYTSLEPCPMCTATLCVCRMKRIVFLFKDDTYGGSFDWRGQPDHGGIKQRYYASYQLKYEEIDLAGETGGIADHAEKFYQTLVAKIGVHKGTPGSFRKSGMYDTLFFDYLHSELHALYQYFTCVPASALVTTGPARTKNLNTVAGLKKLCNLPYAAPSAKKTSSAKGAS
jgi:tRNA(Arg) A34 adenosine deaminase TadA